MVKRKVAVLIAIVVILCTVVVTPVLALLLHATIVDVEVDFGMIDSNDIEFTQTKAEKATFVNPGDKVIYNYDITNMSTTPVRYTFDISMTEQVNYDVRAVLIYFDDIFCGTLASHSTADSEYFLLAATTSPRVATHKLTLEYHNGAEGSFNDGKSIDISVSLNSSTIDYKRDLIASTSSNLASMVADVNNSAQYTTIRLDGRVTLKSNIVINRSTTIDFTGGAIDFGGYSITVAGGIDAVCEVKIVSRGEVVSYNIKRGSLVVNGANAHINYCDKADVLAANMVIVKANVSSVVDMLEDEIKVNMGSGYLAGATSKLLGANHYYLNNSAIAINGANITANDKITYLRGMISVARSALSYQADIALAGKTIIIKVLGTNYMNETEYLYDKMIADGLAHIDAITVERSTLDITYDIFLPTSLPRYNATIRWVSDNPDMISSKGECGSSVEGNVTLYAYITINGDQLVKQYNLRVLTQSNQMRFDYLVARIGEQRLTALYDASMPKGSYFVLPIVRSGDPEDYRSMYSITSLGLENIRYELSPVFNYLMNVPNNKVALTDYTFESSAEVRIYGRFSNEMDKEYSSSIPIVIEPIDSPDMHKKILEVLQSRLNSIDILELIMTSRGALGMANENAVFTMPGYYSGFNINYTISDGNPAGKVELVETELREDRYYIITPDLTLFGLNNTRAILNATIVFAGELPGAETSSPLNFTVPKALTNKAGDIEDIGLFYSIKLQMIQQLRGADGTVDIGVPRITNNSVTQDIIGLQRDYILLVDIARMTRLVIADGEHKFGGDTLAADGDYYYYHVGNLNGNYSGLLSAKMLDDIAVVSSGELITTSSMGAKIYQFAVSNYKLKSIKAIGCMLTNVDSLVMESDLISIDISSNPIVAFEWVYMLMNNAVEYINLSNTSYDIVLQEGYLASTYYRYIANVEGKTPRYYYASNILYKPTHSVTALEHINYLYSLRIPAVHNTSQMQLASRVVKPGGGYVAVSWGQITVTNVVSINLYNGIYYLKQATYSGTNPPNGTRTMNVVIRATVSYTDNGVTSTVYRDATISVWY